MPDPTPHHDPGAECVCDAMYLRIVRGYADVRKQVRFQRRLDAIRDDRPAVE